MKVPEPGNQVLAGSVDYVCRAYFGVCRLNGNDLIASKNYRLVFAYTADRIDDGDIGNRRAARMR
jgi:hypothetical protein